MKQRGFSPLLDRIDLYVQMGEIAPDDKLSVSSREMFETVKKVFILQKERGQTEFNGKLSDREIQKYCTTDDESQKLLESAVPRFDLSQRAINKTLKVARTIADIEESEDIRKSHMLEALQYRFR